LPDRDVAAILGVQPDTVRRWVASGELPAVRLHRLLRFRRKDVEAWIETKLSVQLPALPRRPRSGAIRSV
jgi:excisionase family DNA binding protein